MRPSALKTASPYGSPTTSALFARCETKHAALAARPKRRRSLIYWGPPPGPRKGDGSGGREPSGPKDVMGRVARATNQAQKFFKRFMWHSPRAGVGPCFKRDRQGARGRRLKPIVNQNGLKKRGGALAWWAQSPAWRRRERFEPSTHGLGATRRGLGRLRLGGACFASAASASSKLTRA
jgi:hypothetical protein